jgi:competence protein ComEC
MERPLFLPLLSTIVGFAAAHHFLCFVPEFFLYISLAASFAFLFIKRPPFFLAALTLFFFSWGNLSLKPFLISEHATDDIVRMAGAGELKIEGVIDSRPGSTEKGSRLYVRAGKVFKEGTYAHVSGKILLHVGEGSVGFSTGDRIRFVARVKEPRNFGIPGEFDYVRYLAYRQVYCTAFVKNDSDILLMRSKADHRWQHMVDSLAADMGGFISRCVPGEEGYILKALLLGDMGAISKATRDAYTKTGVNHILSISGFHISIVVFFIFHVLLLVAKRSEYLLLHCNVRRVILTLTIPVIIFYLLLSGGAPATVRSVIMIAACILAMLLERDVDPLNSLMLAALAILAVNPPALFDISFQFSFLALWGIVALTPLLIQPFRKFEGTIRYKLIVFFMVSVAATFATLLPVAYYFHRASVTGLISNFVIVPLLGYGAVILGFSALPFIYIFPAAAKLLFISAAFLVKISNLLITRLAELPSLPLMNPTKIELLLFLVFLLIISFVRSNRARLGLCCAVILLFISVKLVVPVTAGNEPTLAITFFSVGQGESTLISFPDGKKMLIDGGGSAREGGMDPGEKLLAPALWRMDAERLDYVVLSHPHPDHMNGLKYILANFDVGEFWESGLPCDSEDYNIIKQTLLARRIPVRKLDAATLAIVIGETRIELLAPFAGVAAFAENSDLDVNDSSLVFRLIYGKFSFLFTGDIGSATEQELVRHPERLACTVLKVPHHGSRFSSTLPFVKAAAPKTALISAGYDNSFGLPSQQTIERLENLGVKVYRTDLDKTIEVLCNNDKLTVSRFGEFRNLSDLGMNLLREW